MMFMQVHIVQRGAVQPLIELLQSPDAQVREMSAFALGRLAQVVSISFLLTSMIINIIIFYAWLHIMQGVYIGLIR